MSGCGHSGHAPIPPPAWIEFGDLERHRYPDRSPHRPPHAPPQFASATGQLGVAHRRAPEWPLVQIGQYPPDRRSRGVDAAADAWPRDADSCAHQRVVGAADGAGFTASPLRRQPRLAPGGMSGKEFHRAGRTPRTGFVRLHRWWRVQQWLHDAPSLFDTVFPSEVAGVAP